jgi:DNA-binding transcriptional LysR family regulator
VELRHLRYFIAIAEEGGFVRAARRLGVAQPALSKQIRDLEAEVGTPLFQRLPRGVRLTEAGAAFLVDARCTLERASSAVQSARGAAERRAATLHFTHTELGVYTTFVERLLAAFRAAHPKVEVQVTSTTDIATHETLSAQRIDVGCAFVHRWPLDGFAGHRLLDCPITGVLLPAGHPLASAPKVRLADLASLPWLHTPPERCPGFLKAVEEAMRERGLVPTLRRERASETPTSNLPIAAGEAWSFATDALAAPYQSNATPIVYRPMVEPPIPSWLGLVWVAPASPTVQHLVEVARTLGLAAQG